MPPPAPDVYLASLTWRGDSLLVGAPVNITAHDGYDNQPNFLPDGQRLLFTSVRSGAQADIYSYDLTTLVTAPVTATSPESEYSAVAIDGGRAISVVRVEHDSTQRLWRFPLTPAPGTPSVILERVKPVGYHAWVDDHTLALFVLGSPNSLQLADTRSGRAETIATGIGRSLHRVPGTRLVSFVHKLSDSEWWIKSLDVDSRRIGSLVRLPAGTEDYVWLTDGSVLCGRGSALLRWRRGGGDGWEQVADLGPAGVRAITRLALSPAGDRLALVGDGR